MVLRSPTVPRRPVSPRRNPRADLPAWGRALLTAAGVAALAGAGQLGVAYGLGIVQLTRRFEATAPDEWNAQLAWIAFFAMVAAVAGGYVAQRVGARLRLPATTGTRVGLAAAAGLGGAIVAPLTMQPARGAQLYATMDAVLVTGLTGMIGAAAGAVLAAVALAHRAVRWNMAMVAGAAWLFGLLSAAPSLGPDDPLPHIRLGVLDAAGIAAGTTQRLAILGIPVIALLAGVAAGSIARGKGQGTVQVAVTGLAGPALLALAYVIAGPGNGGEKTQAAPYWGALIAVAAGALGSVLAAVLQRMDAPSPEFARPAPQASRPEPRTSEPRAFNPALDHNREDLFGNERETTGPRHGRRSESLTGTDDPLSPNWSGIPAKAPAGDRRESLGAALAATHPATPSGTTPPATPPATAPPAAPLPPPYAPPPVTTAASPGDEWSGLTDSFATRPRPARKPDPAPEPAATAQPAAAPAPAPAPPPARRSQERSLDLTIETPPAFDWPSGPRAGRSDVPAQRPAADLYNPGAWEPPAAEEPEPERPKRRWGRGGSAKADRQASKGDKPAAKGDKPARSAPPAEPKVSARDEEYVDWVSGLGND